MISQWLSAALARRNIHYGWVMVGVTFLTAVITAGTVGAPGVFIVPLQKEFGWSTAEISSALSIRFVLFGLIAPFAAALHNRFGLRNVTLSALVIVASALVVSLTMTKILAADAAVGRGDRARDRHDRAGARSHRGSTLVHSTTRVGGGHSHRSRSHGQLVFLPLLASLTERMGWRVALGLMCALLGACGLGGLDDDARPPKRHRAYARMAITAVSNCRRRRQARRPSWRRRSAHCAMPRNHGCSGCCSPLSLFAVPAPPA